MVPARGYFDLADLVVTYEGPFADYARRLAGEPEWVRDEPTAHLVYAASREQADAPVRRSGPQHLALRHVGRATQPLGRPAAVPARRKEHAMPVTRTIVLAAIALAGTPAAALGSGPSRAPWAPARERDRPARAARHRAGFVAPGTRGDDSRRRDRAGPAESGDAALNRAKRTFSLRSRARATAAFASRASAVDLARASYRCAAAARPRG